MERIPPLARMDAINWAIASLPKGIARRLQGIHFIVGIDPIYMGLHATEKYSDNRSFRECSHVSFKCLQDSLPLYMRETTIVIGNDIKQYDDPRMVVLHELGHALDERIGFYRPRSFVPLDWYAETNEWEAFATSFQAWANRDTDGGREFHCYNELLNRDMAAVKFFDRLAE